MRGSVQHSAISTTTTTLFESLQGNKAASSMYLSCTQRLIGKQVTHSHSDTEIKT